MRQGSGFRRFEALKLSSLFVHGQHWRFLHGLSLAKNTVYEIRVRQTCSRDLVTTFSRLFSRYGLPKIGVPDSAHGCHIGLPHRLKLPI